MNQDSTGKTIKVGTLVRWRGKVYTIKSFGVVGDLSVEFREPLHTYDEVPRETTIDRIDFKPSERTLVWDEIDGFIVSTVRRPPDHPSQGYETVIKGRDGYWGWGNFDINSGTEAEARVAHAEACAFVRSKSKLQ